MTEILLDSLLDSVKTMPVLFLIYLLIEWIEKRASGTMHQALQRIEKSGPAVGSLLGIVPQCGLSAAAAELYTGGFLSIGTLTAVFLSTSDEMLPIFISEEIPLPMILSVIAAKAVIACISGFAVSFFYHHLHRKRTAGMSQNSIQTASLLQNSETVSRSRSREVQGCGCSCGRKGNSYMRIAAIAFWKTVKIALFIFLVTMILNLIMAQIDERILMESFRTLSFGGVILSALVGLIPSCASSVIITELYIGHVIGSGAMMAGLLMNSGVGLLVLFREQRNWRRTLKIAAILFVISIFWGLLIQIFTTI